MFDTLRDNAGALIAFLFIIDMILIAAVIVLYRQWSLLRRNISILKRGAEGETLLEKAATHTAAIEDIYRRIDEQVAQKDYLTEVLAGTVQRIAMKTASLTAVPPSYRLAFETSIPVSWQISV